MVVQETIEAEATRRPGRISVGGDRLWGAKKHGRAATAVGGWVAWQSTAVAVSGWVAWQ